MLGNKAEVSTCLSPPGQHWQQLLLHSTQLTVRLCSRRTAVGDHATFQMFADSIARLCRASTLNTNEYEEVQQLAKGLTVLVAG